MNSEHAHEPQGKQESDPAMYELLKTINNPAELRALDRRQLPQLAEELRAFLIESVRQTGGHLSSNLGTVELTIALHYVFDTPDDRLVWDVGHQTYAHKILTGRREGMARLRMHGGISGFPRRDGKRVRHFRHRRIPALRSRRRWAWRVAARLQGEDRRAVAIIGDGAMTAGMAFEALNNAGVDGRQPAGDSQRQRHVDFAPGRRAQQLSGAAAVGPLLRRGAQGKREGAGQGSAAYGNWPSAPRSTSRAW